MGDRGGFHMKGTAPIRKVIVPGYIKIDAPEAIHFFIISW
jgi:hypothetical protein